MYKFTGLCLIYFSFRCTTTMNIHRGYEGPRNEAFFSLHSRWEPRTTDDPPPPFVTMQTTKNVQWCISRHFYVFRRIFCYGQHSCEMSKDLIPRFCTLTKHEICMKNYKCIVNFSIFTIHFMKLFAKYRKMQKTISI